jgi:tRNA (cytidine/uridine-2'-O-)-methyltransferase
VTSLHVVLVEPEIHWNTGNAGRTCLAAGAQLHLVEPLGFSLDEREVRRAGLDYWPRVRPRVWPSWESLEEVLPELGEPFLFSAEAPRSLWSAAYPERTVLVFGRESSGLPLGLRKRYPERLLALPMLDPELRSLNLSSCVAVALYEVLRQREMAHPGSLAAAARQRGAPLPTPRDIKSGGD